MEWNNDWGELASEHAEHDLIQQVPDLPTMARNYIEATNASKTRLPIPGKDAGSEAWAEFYRKLIEQVPGMIRIRNANGEIDEEGVEAAYKTLGRPDDPDGYELPELTEEQIANGVKFDREIFDAIKPAAHAMGVSSSALQKIMEKVAVLGNERGKASNANKLQIVKDLQDEFGAAFQRKMVFAKLAAKKYGLDIDNTALFNSKEAIAAFADMGEMFTEDPNFDATRMLGGSDPTPAEAKKEHDEIMANQEHPYWKGDEEAIKRVRQLKWWASGKTGPAPDPFS